MSGLISNIRTVIVGTFSLLKRVKIRTRKQVFVALLAVILLVVLGFGVAIFGFNQDNATVRTVARIVPYPAALVNFSAVNLNDYYFTQTFTEHFYTASKLEYDAKTTNQQILEQLIDQKLVVQNARKLNVKVTKSEVDDAFKQLVEKSGQDEVNKVLSDLYGLSEIEFKNLIYYQVLKQKLETTLRDKGAWHQVQVRHLLIKVDTGADQKTIDQAKAKAEENLKKIGEGKSFDEMAKANSEDVESKDQGGELGYVNRGQTVKEFEDAIFAAKKGDLIGPIRTQYGWHIISIEDVRGDNDYQIWRAKAKIYKLI